MVKIIDGYGFTCDRMQYTLFKTGQRERVEFKTKKPTGEMTEYTVALGYFSDIASMLTWLLRYETNVRTDIDNVDDIETYLKVMTDVKNEILAKMKDIENITTG